MLHFLFGLGRWRYFISPADPTGPPVAGEQFDVGPRATTLDDLIKLMRLARVACLLVNYDVGLSASALPCPQMASDSKQAKLGDVAEVEADSSAVGAPVLAD